MILVFSSIVFIVYFLPVTIAGYYFIRFSRGAQNFWLLGASLVFYAWGEPVFVFVIAALTAVNYVMLLIIDRYRDNRRRAFICTVITCAINLSILFICKHLQHIIEGIERVFLFSDNTQPYLSAPIGMSFYTLRAVSIAVDVYKGRAQPSKNPLNTALYLTFFPTYIAGPVMRYSDIDGQLLNRRESWQGFSTGVCRFITGLAKKALIADSLAAVADHIFSYSAMSNEITRVPALMAWIGAIAFMLQIYYDLSGYTDMAIGLGRMFGFELQENFDYPFVSLSIVEFWSKWNISLIGWFREYIYYPLGGSLVKNNDKMVRNIFILWLFIGLWHGAKWTFVLWGMWQFFFSVLERVTNYERRQLPNPVRRVYVLIVLLFGFVLFRTDDIYQATLFFSNMLGLNHNGIISDTALMFIRECWLPLAAGIGFSLPISKKLSAIIHEERAGKYLLTAAYPALMITALYIAAAYIARNGGYPFIYFRF